MFVNGTLVRYSRICNHRQSAFDFIKRHTRDSPLVQELVTCLESMAAPLCGTPEEYFPYIGENGIVYVLDKTNGELIDIAALTPASANKPMAWGSPFYDTIARLADCEPDGMLTHAQKSQLEWLAAFSPSAFAFATVGRQWAMNGGLPKGDLIAAHIREIITLWGSYAMVPMKRTIPSANSPITPEANKRSVRLFTSMRMSNEHSRSTVNGTARRGLKKETKALFSCLARKMSHPRSAPVSYTHLTLPTTSRV